jgi:enamine deaminase RidA (YjgF/YER057c/UK114 family)
MVTHISSGSPFEAKIGYSRAVVDGDMVYVSGTTGYDYATMTMPEDAGAQARNALASINRALEAAGSSLRDTVRVRYYLSDMAWYDALVEVAGDIFGDIRPAATMVVCGLVSPEMKLEIEVTARIGAHQS